MLYYLAFAFLLQVDIEPTILNVYKSKEDCIKEADKQNRNNKTVRDLEVRKKGGEFVCLKVERVYI